MAAKPDRDTRNESFQCVVCALLQYYRGIASWMVFDFILDPNPQDSDKQKAMTYVKEHTDIPDWCWQPSAP